MSQGKSATPGAETVESTRCCQAITLALLLTPPNLQKPPALQTEIDDQDREDSASCFQPHSRPGQGSEVAASVSVQEEEEVPGRRAAKGGPDH